MTAELRIRRKPTHGDLVALLTWAAHHVGNAHGHHANDRDPMGYERAQQILEDVQHRLHEAAGHFPYPRKSPWTELLS